MARPETLGPIHGFPRFAPLPRSAEAELMDERVLDPAELAANFRDIRRVNALLGGRATTLRHLPALLDRVPAGRTPEILDIATGCADIPIAIHEWSLEHTRPLALTASDVTPEIIEIARAQIGSRPISVTQHDARSLPLADHCVDIALCAMSLHHFDPEDAVRVLAEMRRVSRVGFILNDLRRDRLGYGAAWLAAKLTTRNRLTRNDAPLSVRRAYTPAELRELLTAAGAGEARVTTHPWFRMAAVYVHETAHA